MGLKGLASLVQEFEEKADFLSAAKVEVAASRVVGEQTQSGISHSEAALALIEDHGLKTLEAQQVELRIREKGASVMRPAAERTRHAARLKELLAAGLTLPPLSAAWADWTRIMPLSGRPTTVWDAPGYKGPTEDSLAEYFSLLCQIMPLLRQAAREAVGVRREAIEICNLVFSSVNLPLASHQRSAVLMYDWLQSEDPWGGPDRQKLLVGCCAYRTHRHFELTRSFGYGYTDTFTVLTVSLDVLAHAGDIEQAQRLLKCQSNAILAYIKGEFAPGCELPCFLVRVAPGLTCMELDGLGVPSFHPAIQKIFVQCGCTDSRSCDQLYNDSEEFAVVRMFERSSEDGQHRAWNSLYFKAVLCAGFALTSSSSMGNEFVGVDFVDGLLPDHPSMTDSEMRTSSYASARVLVAELLEGVGRVDDALLWARAELADRWARNNGPSQARAGRIVGRCHAARGEHALSASAFDASMHVAITGRFLLDELLAVRGRALAGRKAGGAAGHWLQVKGEERVSEVLKRMQLREEDRAALLRSLEC